MSTDSKVELALETTEDGRLRLLAPDVGTFTGALDRGAAVAPGQVVGTLAQLGRELRLVAPAGAYGSVVSARPERVLAPVGFGDVLLELDPSGVTAERAAAGARVDESAGPIVRAAHGGRFYRRAAPDQPPFVDVGSLLEDGAPLGLIEVMKTFSHVVYRAGAGLPARARVVRVVAEDGADLDAGAPLLEVEPA